MKLMLLMKNQGKELMKLQKIKIILKIKMKMKPQEKAIL